MTEDEKELLAIEASLRAELDAVSAQMEPLELKRREIFDELKANREIYVNTRFGGRTNEEFLDDPELIKELFEINWSGGAGNAKTSKICDKLFKSLHSNFMTNHQAPPSSSNGYTDVYQSLMFYVKKDDDLDVLEASLTKLADVLLAASGQETITLSTLDKYAGERGSVEVLYTSPDQVEVQVSRYGKPEFSTNLRKTLEFLKESHYYE